MKLDRKECRRIAYALVLAFAVLFFCSKSSPIYPINDWADANVYLTIGKGMTQGKIPYRDLYDHKGPLLFALHALCAFVSFDSFAGVFLMEVLQAAAFVYVAHRFFESCGLQRMSWIAVTVLAVAAYTSFSFSEGDSAEEMAFPFIMGTLYGVTVFFQSGEARMRTRSLITHGILAGCVFWIKFTMIGLHAGLLLALFIRAWALGGLKEAMRTLGWLIAGFVVSTLPWVLYFGLSGALGDFLKTYLYDNLFLYSAGEAAGLADKLKAIVKAGLSWFVNNPGYSLFILIGFISAWKMEKWMRLTVWLMTALGALAAFIGGKEYVYYGLVLVPAAAPGIAAVCCWRAKQRSVRMTVIVCAVLIALTPVLTQNVNPPFGAPAFEKRENTMQYRFAAIMQETPNATLLNYGFMDAGFYTAANVVPTVKYFHQTNVPLEEMLSEQERYIREGLCDYVVTRGKQPECIHENYDLIATEKSPNFWYESVHLYRLKTLGKR